METEYDVYKALEQLSDMRAQQDAIRLRFDEMRAGIITPEIKQQLDDLQAEQDGLQSGLAANMNQLESEIKAFVIGLGVTVKGAGLMAVYNKGRVSWDSKYLDGYAAAHPEILDARKVGEPSVSIR